MVTKCDSIKINREPLLLGIITDEEYNSWHCPHRIQKNINNILFVYYLLDKEPSVKVLDVHIPVFERERWCLSTNIGKICHDKIIVSYDEATRQHTIYIK